ncbi:hypothetical protein Pan241w_53160 [Gimesia alba]|uniref:Uncharacterized protein n=1 Tax=Gimesia alba TaxID=2527973 RepID=A0A517RMT5_9PLAN|nr:hypothetical protein [Gimesia alba]QDT45197.1 hypothetical protein Pan241w_53160 [Gimesia alba]
MEAFLWLFYILAGILIFAAYPNLGLVGKTTYTIFFPVHWAVLSFVSACITHQGNFQDNPIQNLLIPFGVILLLWLLCSL